MIRIAVVCVALILAGCQAQPDQSRCVAATDIEIETISAGLVKAVDGPLRLSDAWAVKSNDFSNVWMVAGFIYGEGQEMEKGVGPGAWAHGGEQDDPRTILAIGGFAHQFSNWGPGETTDAEISLFSDGVQEAIHCAKAKHK